MSFRKSSHSKAESWDGQHRFEHWYRDNTVYFITSKVRDGAPPRSGRFLKKFPMRGTSAIAANGNPLDLKRSVLIGRWRANWNDSSRRA
ncbi:MAG: hypothetical protein ABIP55_12040 [Tepidisphaeraceae bacterium]